MFLNFCVLGIPNAQCSAQTIARDVKIVPTATMSDALIQ